MAEDTAVTQPDGDDYEYDEAHDADGGAQQQPAGPPPVRLPEGIHVADTGGDYGYDCAHDQS
ncbi:hypothetical protein [Actinoplanes sp. NPDC026623]|uniref:hypothetical protein n=1 Tax=Actinoplanes sp. NPDC026623 TaxID=3155610 RepID=UPI0033C6A173